MADFASAVQKPLRYVFMEIEGVFDRIFGTSWNPLYHFGSLGYFYFWIVAISGIYVYIFFDTTVPEAYFSVEYLTEDQWYLGGVMRSLHRYASDALVVMMALHIVREFAYDRYRSARWFTWVTGVPVVWMVFAAGLTGYWLVWDRLAQYVAEASTEWLDWLPIFGEPVARNFLAPSHLDDRFFSLMLFLHIAVPLIMLFVLWVHLQRVSYARQNPPVGLAVGTLLMLLGLSAVQPAVSQGIADLARAPSPVDLDWYYLWAFPLVDVIGPGAVWAIAVGGSFFLCILPWLPPKRREAAAIVDLDNCNGCHRCADDCPFNAITMMPRSDGKPFEHEAVVRTDLCVSCGICVGSCPTAMPFRTASDLVPGIDLPGRPAAELRDAVAREAGKLSGDRRVLIFACDHGFPAAKHRGPEIGVVSLPCVAMLPPPFIDYALSKRLADGVAVAGCRPGECHFRLGVEWTEARIAGERDPHLRRRVPRDRLTTIWAAPTDWRRFERELNDFRRRISSTDDPETQEAAE